MKNEVVTSRIDPQHKHWCTQCSDCGEWFTKKGVFMHKARKHKGEPMNKYIQQSEKCNCHHQCGCDKGKCNCYPAPPHKEHGEGLEDWAKEFVKIRVKHRGEAYGGIAIAIEEYDFISQLLLSTQQEAVEKERERIMQAMKKASGGGNWRRVLEMALTQKETV